MFGTGYLFDKYGITINCFIPLLSFYITICFLPLVVIDELFGLVKCCGLCGYILIKEG